MKYASAAILKTSVAAAAILLSASGFSAYAEDNVVNRPKDDDAIITFQFENDVFSGQDSDYTNGVRLAYLSPETTIPHWLDAGASALPFFASEGHKRWSVAVGQNMYTPSDILVKAPQPDDHPYAGWTYGSVGVISDTGRTLDNLQLTLGMVGPASGAAQTQDFVHSLINSRDPQGWKYQLHNEPGIILTYERKWRGLYEFSPFGLGVDITPTVGGSIGNIYDVAAVGTIVRFGYDLPADYGPPMIAPNLPGSDFFIPSKDFSWYLFTGVEGRAVARNIFLDGNTFKDSPSVDKYPFVGGLQAGLAIIVADTRIAYTQVLRSKEFTNQPHAEQFGALTVSRRF